MLRVNYGLWLLRFAAWDGLLPVGVAVAPYAIQMLLPNRLGAAATVLAAVTLPATAFHLRLGYGQNHIASNGCSIGVRRVQSYALYVGILPLAMIDFSLIYSHVMPGGIAALFESTSDVAAFAFCVGTYIGAMVVAMYPGSGGEAEHYEAGVQSW